MTPSEELAIPYKYNLSIIRAQSFFTFGFRYSFKVAYSINGPLPPLPKLRTDLLDKFVEESKKLVYKHPYFVVITMHEYFRNIWPNDPFINEKLADDKLESISLCLKNCLNLLSWQKNLVLILLLKNF